MESKDLKKLRRGVVTGQVAGRNTDPNFYAALQVLPNPDPILRAMGRAEEAYSAIMADSHVIGELRPVRAGLLSYKGRVVAGENADESAKQKQVLELCKSILKKPPAEGMTWPDIFWNMGTATLRGFRVHEVVWEVIDGQLLPDQVLDRPNRRFKFDNDNKLRLLTKDNPIEGEETEPYKYLVTRHMPSSENPYGQALLSSCFWPYTFKHGGWKMFYQFCERFGMPYAIGRNRQGATEPEKAQLLDALLDMLAEGAASVDEGSGIELLSINHSGELAQESMINLANREMSKALTSQTLATEMGKNGSNAASKTHREREMDVHESDRAIIEASMNALFADVTRFNYGPDAIPPTFELFKPKQVKKERADTWEIAARIGRPSIKAFHKEMNIPEAEDESDRMQPQKQAVGREFTSGKKALEFSQKNAHLDNVVSAANKAIESDLLEPIADLLDEYEAQGKTLQQFLDDLPHLFASLDDSALIELNDQVISYAVAEGMASV